MFNVRTLPQAARQKSRPFAPFDVQRSTFNVRRSHILLFLIFPFLLHSPCPAQAQLPPPPSPTQTQPQIAPQPQPQSQPEEDIRPPRPPITIPTPPKSRTTLYLTTAGVLALTGTLIWFLSRRRIQRLSLTPLEKAREALRHIDAERTTLTAGDLATRTAGVVRQFIADNFAIAAPQRTTEEFFKSLATTPGSPLHAHTALLQSFLTSCDMAKFARNDFDGVERFSLLETANKFVQAAAYVAPVLPAASAPAPASASAVPPAAPAVPSVPSPAPPQ